uniref:Uncharacterized protein n=1 Tax=Arundo donax TaxID=35708 RepID=A0A0A9DFS0_ARUDO
MYMSTPSGRSLRQRKHRCRNEQLAVVVAGSAVAAREG